jgi:hypothetical protein
MIKFKFIWVYLLTVLLFNCIKEEDSLTYLKAVINGKKSTLTYVEAKYTRLPIASGIDSMDVLTIYGIKSDYKKDLILDLRTIKLLPKEYSFGNTTDSIFLVQATYKQDSSFFCTSYNNYLTNPGTLVITKIGNNYVKGLFAFNAALKDKPDSVISITSGSFFAKIK